MSEQQATVMLAELSAIRQTLNVVGVVAFFVMLAEGAALGARFFR